MIQPTQVLPSNAPPLRDRDNVHQASRVLQEHSGNRQLNAFGFSIDFEQKYPSSVSTENSYPRHHNAAHHQVPQHQHLYHPQPQHRHALRYSYGQRGYYRSSPEDEARIQYQSDRLYERFRQSEQYIKYRSRQAKDDKGNGDQKWPDHLEKAFFRALVKYPPMGRRKTLHKDKQRGRNELIADEIEDLTGETRSRKQVSSHIQVLKPFVEQDSLIMKFLSKEDLAGKDPRYHGHTLAYGSGRRMSNYPVTAPPQAIRTAVPTLQRAGIQDLQKLKHNLDVFEPTDFQIFVQRKLSDDPEDVHRLHTYTQSVSYPLGPELLLNDWHAIGQEYPLLATLNTLRPLDCNVVVAEASIAFPPETWKDISSVELGIFFQCNSRHLLPTSRDVTSPVRCHNSFYENGVYLKEHSGPSEIMLTPAREGVETKFIKFGSTFWAKTLGGLAKKLHDSFNDALDEGGNSVSAYLKGITAIQEITVLSEHRHERILVMHWNFRHSTGPRGRASWRRLLLPSPKLECEPTPKSEDVNPMYGYSAQFADASTSRQQHALSQSQSQSILQSPFEYDSSSGSALSSATWPTLISASGMTSHQNTNAEFAADNSFDFDAGTINIAYDQTLNFDTFDSSAFNFDVTAADLVADPALPDYSQEWSDTYATGFAESAGIVENTAYNAQPDLDGQGQVYDPYGGTYDQHAYVGPHDPQAYGGAGQDGFKDEDALVALADASYIVRSLGTKQGLT